MEVDSDARWRRTRGGCGDTGGSGVMLCCTRGEDGEDGVGGDGGGIDERGVLSVL